MRSSVLVQGVLLALLLSACGGGPSREQVLRSEKEYDLAVGLWQEQNLAGAFQHLFNSVEMDPDNAEAHLLLGNLFMFRSDWDRAEKHFKESLRANLALGKGGRPSLNSEANNSLGVLYIHQEQPDKAIPVLKKATQDLLNRTPHLAWGNLGWAHYEKKDYNKALRALTQSVRMQRRFCTGYYRIGQVKIAQKDYEDAEEALTEGLEVEEPSCQSFQEAWKLRGQVRARLGRREDALSDFEHCVELNPKTPIGKECQSFLDDHRS